MTQEEQLLKILKKNKSIQLILERAENLHMPNWYLGAGCIAQTAWNIQHGFDPEYGIQDYDLVYYDADNTSYESEDVYIQKAKELFKDIPVLVEIRNQARVHLWYKDHFGHPIEQYKSVEEAINTWPTTATAIGVKNLNNEYKIYAPFGLDDLFNLVVRANKQLITKKIYQDKVNRWINNWPNLKIVPWD